LINTIGAVLIVVALSIASIGYIWQFIKPTVEKYELRVLSDSYDENLTLKDK
jgi:hypothetical protein